MVNRRKPVQLRGEAKREALLAAAWDVFREAGYPNASVDEITRRAGGSKVSLYAHFGGKAALFEAVVRWRAEAVAASYAPALVPDQGIEATLTALATAVFAGMTSTAVRDLHRVALSAQPSDSGIGKLLFKHGTMRVLRSAAAVIAARMKTGDLVDDDSMAAAESLFGLLLGVGYIRFALGVPQRLSAAAREKHVARAVRFFLTVYRPA